MFLFVLAFFILLSMQIYYNFIEDKNIFTNYK